MHSHSIGHHFGQMIVFFAVQIFSFMRLHLLTVYLNSCVIGVQKVLSCINVFKTIPYSLAYQIQCILMLRSLIPWSWVLYRLVDISLIYSVTGLERPEQKTRYRSSTDSQISGQLFVPSKERYCRSVGSTKE